MLCQQCKKNPVAVNYIESINGNKVELHLCASCYFDMCGETSKKINSNLYAGFFSSAKPKLKSCAVCGTTYGDYERYGLLGCAACYDVFKDELIPSILRIQGKTEHIGKTGEKNDELMLNVKLKELQKQLEEAIRDKRFGEADVLNRRITSLKKQKGGRNG